MRPSSGRRSSEEGAPDNPFLDYAAGNWGRHLADLSSEESKNMWPILEVFFDPQLGNFEYWASVVRYTYGEYRYPLGLTPIHVCALYGLKSLAAMLVTKNHRCDAQTNDRRTALHIALENGHNDLVELLINAKAPLDPADRDGRCPLHLAIELGNEWAVNLLISAGANTSASLPGGDTPLSMAIENKWDALVQILLKQSDPKTLLTDGRSILHLAAQSGNEEYARFLLKDRQVEVDQEDCNGWTPLHFAGHDGHYDIVGLLLGRNASLSHPDKNGWTPLHAAIRGRHLDSATLMVKTKPRHLGARRAVPSSSSGSSSGTSLSSDAERWRKYGGRNARSTTHRHDNKPPTFNVPTPLSLAVSENFPEAVDLLMKYSHLSGGRHDMLDCLEKSLTLPTPIVLASLLGHAQRTVIYRFLPKAVADKRGDFLSAVHQSICTSNDVYGELLKNAIEEQQKDIIEFLLKEPTPRETQVLDRLFATAIQCSNFETARRLVEKGANHSAQDDLGLTPLQCAIQSKNYLATRFLLDSGARDCSRATNGETALHTLARIRLIEEEEVEHDWAEIALFLVEHGSDVSALDNNGQSMLHKAAASNNGQLVTFALAFGLLPDFSDKDGETPIHKAVKHSYLNILGPLLENHSRVGPRRVLTMMTNRDGNIPSLLVSAAHASDSDVLELLVTSRESARYHLDPEGESESPLTLQYTEALQAAAANGSEGCSWLLLKKGADVHYRNAAGETALHLAAKNGHEKVILLLLQKGSDIHATTTISGESPLHLAASRGSTAAVHALLEKGATADGKAITCAASSGDTATMKLILRAQVSDVDGAKSATLATISALHQTVQTGNDSMVRVLLANATDIIHSRTTSGETVFHIAARNGDTATLSILLEHSADKSLLDAKAGNGETALLLAAKHGNGATVDMLMNNGANKWEALEWATRNRCYMWMERLG